MMKATSPEGTLSFTRWSDKKLHTQAIDTLRFYDERRVGQWRYWDPYKSKVSAGLHNGLRHFPLRENSRVLYVGASTGTTVSHLADICRSGALYCVELSVPMMTLFMKVAYARKHVFPVLADARQVTFEHTFDVLIQDIATTDQVDVFIRLCQQYLRGDGYLVIKTQSISREKPGVVVEQIKKKLRKHVTVHQTVRLDPYEKKHWLLDVSTLEK